MIALASLSVSMFVGVALLVQARNAGLPVTRIALWTRAAVFAFLAVTGVPVLLAGCSSQQGQAAATDLDKVRGAVRAVCSAFGMVDGLVPQHYGVADAGAADASAVPVGSSGGSAPGPVSVPASIDPSAAMDAGL